MKKRFIRNIICLLLAGSVASFVGGCKSGSHGSSGGKKPPILTPPTSPMGSLVMPLAGALSNPNTTGCFPKSQGWDKYIVVPSYFVGPNYTASCNNCILNSSNYPTLTISTCNVTNGTTLQTGIQIQYEYNPADKVCATNTPSCIISPTLTTVDRTLTNGRRYRVTVFYKSTTAAGLNGVVVDWRYVP